MKIHSVQQGGAQWLALRAGKPTASEFSILMTPEARKGKLTKGVATYRNHLLAEWMEGQSIEFGKSGFMLRGSAMEAQAWAAYEFDRRVEVRQVGFVTDDAETYGCSPDRLIGPDGGGESKILSAHEHIGTYLGANHDHDIQVQGNLWICGRAWWDLFFWHPTYPETCIRIDRDEELIATLAGQVKWFLTILKEAKASLLAGGYKPRIPASGDLSGPQTDDQRFDAAWAADADPGASKAVRAAELAAAIRMMPDNEDRASLYFRYMLSADLDLERSIAGLSDGMLEELNADIGMARSGI